MVKKRIIDSFIIYRLTLAKILFKSGVNYMSEKYNVYSVSQGLISIHDALDNFLGATASYYNAKIDLNHDTLLNVFDKVEKEIKKTNKAFAFEYRNEIEHLNALRNNIKHKGITPNVNQASLLVSPISKFFNIYCKQFFNRTWIEISFSDLIKDPNIKKKVINIEKLIDGKKYKQALSEIGIIKFRVFAEKSFEKDFKNQKIRTISFNPGMDIPIGDEKNVFPSELQGSVLFNYPYNDFELHQKGISLETLNLIDRLCGEVGIDNGKDWNYIFKHNSNWGKPNWTKQNAEFCLDIIVDAILKTQNDIEGYSEKRLLVKYKIKIVEDDIELHEATNEKDKITLKKGDILDDVIIPSIVDGKWEDEYSRGPFLILPDKKGKEYFLDKGNKNKVKIISKNIFVINKA